MRNHPRSRWRRRPWLANTGLVVASIVAVLLAGEIGMRLTHDHVSLWHWPNFIAEAAKPDPTAVLDAVRHDAELGWVPRPGAVDTVYRRRIDFSFEGFRIARPPNARPPESSKEAPILAVGDSFTEGWGLEADQPWPARLEAETGRTVINAGVRGYGLDQIVLRTERLLGLLKPSLVILAFIEEDIDRLGSAVHGLHYKPWFAPVDDKAARSPNAADGLVLHGVPVPPEPYDGPTHLWRRVLGYSYLADAVMRHLGLFELWGAKTVSNGVTDTDLVACRLMQRFARDLKRHDLPGLVVALPEYREWATPALHVVAQRRNAAVLKCARDAGLRTLDVWDDLEKAGITRSPEDFNNDGMHLNARGQAIAARSIAAALQ
jgi:lysophospholipase L1-like esterase